MNLQIYLDHAATTPPSDGVRAVMMKTLEEDYGNPSSLHTKGMEAEQYIREAKEYLAKSLKAEPKEIFFTSGGTESNNMALIGTALAAGRAGRHIVTTKIEHASVWQPLLFLEDHGYEITWLDVDHTGRVSAEQVADAVREDTILVSVMYVNNEIGSVQPIADIGRAVKEKNPSAVFHVDAIQAYGKYRIAPKQMKIDLMSVSGHKIHGPKGAGFLYVREKVKLKPILYGGGQQGGMRSGTENVPGIAGLTQAAKEIYRDQKETTQTLYALKRYFIEEIRKIEGTWINGMEALSLEETAPHIVSVSFEGIRAEVMLHALAERGICVSSGSACSSNHPAVSGTLKAIGLKKELLDRTLRFSFSGGTTKEELERTAAVIKELLPELRKFIRK